MTDLVVLGTDTAAGKTTFTLLWLAAFADEFEYWKPLETGESDSAIVVRLVPSAIVHPPLARFGEPVAPLLAARRAGLRVPSIGEIVAAKPRPHVPARRLLIETFGSPLSPLGEHALQIELIPAYESPSVLVSPSAVGAVGRVLQSLAALASHDCRPAAVVLIGEADAFAVEQISRHAHGVPVFCLQPPATFTADAVAESAAAQRQVLDCVRTAATQAPGSACLRQVDRSAAATDIVARDRRVVWHPYTSLQAPDDPLPVVAAQDEFLMLADGRRVIDAISSWWTVLHGHRHPVLMRALAEASTRYDHVYFAGVTHEPAVELAELLLSTVSWPGGTASRLSTLDAQRPPAGRVLYSDDGSTAVEVALKMAYQFWCHRGEPQHTTFVGFEHGYHGDTFGAMAVGRDPVFFGVFEPLLFRAVQAPVSPDALDAALAERRGEVAAVIIEPLVQGAGGMRMHSPTTLRAIADVVRRHDVLLIADEVMTGGGRTGHLWAHQAAGVAPDLICAGKTLAGGVLPLAATLVGPHVAAAWDTADRRRTFFHGHSFTAHPLACAVAVANWRMLAAGLGDVPAQMERFWTERLSRLCTHPAVRELRTCGTIAAVELQDPGGYLAGVGPRLRRTCLDRDVLLRPLGNVLYAMPPFCTSQRSLEQIAAAIELAVESVA